MQARRTGVTATALAAAGLALAMGASGLGGEVGIALRLRCWLAPSLDLCRDRVRDRENRALEAVEKELRDLNRVRPPICVDPGADTRTPCRP
jgi:hypothetical protein